MKKIKFNKQLIIGNLIILVLFFLNCDKPTSEDKKVSVEETTTIDSKTQKKLLRHVVLFKFKDSASVGAINKVLDAFSELPNKISEIKDFEWGINNSPENLNKGFTHSFILTFNSETDRETYLPHPDHKAFVEIVGPVLEDVLVIDYWTHNK